MIKNTITSHPRTKSPAKFGPQMSYSRCCCVSLYQKFVYLKFRSSLAPENAPTSPPLSEEHMLTVFYEYVCTESSGTCNSVVFNHNSATHSHPFLDCSLAVPGSFWYYYLYITIVGAVLIRHLSEPQPPIAAHKFFPVFL